MAERISSEEQLRRWVEGDPVCRIMEGRSSPECCPDFSCCRPQLLQPKEVRELFVESDGPQRTRMLGQFLGCLMQSEGINGHIAGVPDTREDPDD